MLCPGGPLRNFDGAPLIIQCELDYSWLTIVCSTQSSFGDDPEATPGPEHDA